MPDAACANDPLPQHSRQRVTAASIIHLAAEYGALAKAGGLADAVAGLAAAQARSGVKTAVLLPLYQSVRRAARLEPIDPPFPVIIGGHQRICRLWRVAPHNGEVQPDVLALELEGFDRPGIYGEGGVDYPDNPLRFASFVVAALTALPWLAPGARVVHAHDWHTSLAPVFLRTRFARWAPCHRIGVIVSVHNAAYQGRFAPEVFEDLGLSAALLDGMNRDSEGRYAWLELGLAHTDLTVTVSAAHASEIQTPLGGFGLHQRFRMLGDRLIGLTNGIDSTQWDPRTDAWLAAPFDAESLGGRNHCRRALLASYGFSEDDPAPIVGMVARLVEQKGLDLLLDGTVERFAGVRFIVVGRGVPEYEERLRALAARFPDRVRVPLAFSDCLERQLLAGTDLVLMPSLFEPCGLVQMYAQRYGALPVGRQIGGLAETIADGETGFLFQEYSPAALQEALGRALVVWADRPRWEAMMRAGMRRDFGWGRTVVGYRAAYGRALARRRALVGRWRTPGSGTPNLRPIGDPVAVDHGGLKEAAMLVQINTGSTISGREVSTRRAEAVVGAALARFGHRIPRVEVYLTDGNGQKSRGDDMRCVMEARPASRKPVVVSHVAATVDLAIDGAVERLERLLDNTFGRLDDPKSASVSGQ